MDFADIKVGDRILLPKNLIEHWNNMAKKYEHTFFVMTCEGNYGNVHGVPPETIQKMKDRWEKYDG